MLTLFTYLFDVQSLDTNLHHNNFVITCNMNSTQPNSTLNTKLWIVEVVVVVPTLCVVKYLSIVACSAGFDNFTNEIWFLRIVIFADHVAKWFMKTFSNVKFVPSTYSQKWKETKLDASRTYNTYIALCTAFFLTKHFHIHLHSIPMHDEEVIAFIFVYSTHL